MHTGHFCEAECVLRIGWYTCGPTRTGFQNASHFSRVFRKMVGTTPSMFRADYLQPLWHLGVRQVGFFKALTENQGCVLRSYARITQ
jgi:hypothetical protein